MDNEKAYKITYVGPNGRCAYKTVRAKTPHAAKLRFRKLTGFKAVAAEAKLTAAERRALAAKPRTGRAVYFDGRGLVYCDTDGCAEGNEGYTH